MFHEGMMARKRFWRHFQLLLGNLALWAGDMFQQSLCPLYKTPLALLKHSLGKHCRNRPIHPQHKNPKAQAQVLKSDKLFSKSQGLAGDLSVFPGLPHLVGRSDYVTSVLWVSLSSSLNRKGKCALEIKMQSLYKR